MDSNKYYHSGSELTGEYLFIIASHQTEFDTRSFF